MTGVLRQIGSNAIDLFERVADVPHKNWSLGKWKEFSKISGAVVAEKMMVKLKSCYSCPFICGREIFLTKPTNFYRLIDFEKACPRRMVFYTLKLEGRPQYYLNKVIFERGKVFEYLLNKFSGIKGETDLDRIEDTFKKRFENEDISYLLENLDTLISEKDIKITEVNKKIDYELTEEPIRLYVDAVGTFKGKDALFKFNMGQLFKKNDTLELVCAENLINPDKKKKFKLISLKLGKGDYREIFEYGDRNKDGSLSKRGLPPWEDLRKQADERLKSNYKLKEKLEKDPDRHNIPMFGSCGTCPYHNIEVDYNGKKIICTG